MSQSPQQPSPRDRSLLFVQVVTVVTLVAIGGVVAAAFYGPPIFRADSLSNCDYGSIGGNCHRTEMIIANHLTQTYSVMANSTIDIKGNSNSITLNLRSNLDITLDVVGNSNLVTIQGGSTGIAIVGDYNTINAEATHVLSQNSTGSGNMISTH